MTGGSILEAVIAVLASGAATKFVVDLYRARLGGRKDRAEGSVILVDTAANYAASVNDRLDEVTARFDEYRRQQDTRNRQLDRMFREHFRWDDLVRRKLEELGEGEHVPPPPPLYVEP